MEPSDSTTAATSQTHDGSPGSYALRQLINDVPLPIDENGVQAHITCVDTWNDNLYIGTSNGQVLHYVSIPPEPADDSGLPSYIFATQIEPTFTTQQEGPDAGVKQILLLPSVSKAYIVCNNTLTFYTLPELSPAYGQIKQTGCTWVGGLDHSADAEENAHAGGPMVIICLSQKLRLLNQLDAAKPRRIRDIELGGVRALERRADLACVADTATYSLLDVANQRKNDLFPISSFSEPAASPQDVLTPPINQNRQPSRSFSSRSPIRQGRAHQRNISLGGQPQSNDRLRPDSNSPWPARRSSRQSDESPAAPSSREESPKKEDVIAEKQAVAETPLPETSAPVRPLKPNVLSPTPNEFLLTTGTRMEDPGVGMFVNLDGDVVRGTIEFSTYPESLVLDASGLFSSMPSPDDVAQEGYVLAIVRKQMKDALHRCVEIQRWDAEPGEAYRTKEWLPLEQIHARDSSDDHSLGTGLRKATTSAQLSVTGVSSALRLRRLQVSANFDEKLETKRNDEEDKLAIRFAQIRANVLLYQKTTVSWIAPTPLIEQLDLQLNQAVGQSSDEKTLSIDVSVVQRVVNSIRGQEAKDELEFLTLTYIRQKSALLLFGNLALQTARGVIAYEHDKRRAEDALVAAELDPRVVLALVPPFDQEIAEGVSGIWLPQGLRDSVYTLRGAIDPSTINRDLKGPYGDNLLGIVKRYLLVWRKKKGFGSVADEAHVFRTVDAALLHVILMLDEHTPRGPASAGSVRTELNEVVDNRVECFDRAIELFEQYHRLYMLSRLYQSKSMTSQVLATWKRIIEGESDAGGELIEGEVTVRKYLTKIRAPDVVQTYGAWLANRNPKLGVQVFADDSSKIQFQPSQAVAILKEKAPGAVKDYLEHLVFGKNHVQYVNDLIAFYLDNVLSELEQSKDAKSILTQSYETYRALHPPKPTYREFITDNAVDAEWWHNRLRLLQLIGGSHGAASKYDVHSLGQRLAPYSNELVPEMIILNGREGKHEEALRLLTHGLGDYDTAIRYCLLGGSSIFHPTSSLTPEQPLPTKDEQSVLFEHLLNEFFKLDDLSERLERTAELLERFGGWFDVAKVLAMIPDHWSVELVSGFLVHALRRLVKERNETMIVKALSSAQNLRNSAVFAEKMESAGPTVLRETVDLDVS